MIRIWPFADAPAEYQAMSEHGGDEDWLLHCPAAEIHGWWPMSLEKVIDGSETSWSYVFGHVDRHLLDNGDVVVIFAHA